MRSRIPATFVLLVLILTTTGCGIKQLRMENERMKQEVDRLEQIERDYSDTLASVERLSEEEKASLRIEMSQLRNDLEIQLEQQIKDNKALIRKVEDLTIIEVGDSALFATGQADLTREGARIIRKMTEVLVQYEGYHTRVEGHTDSLPIGQELKSKFASNWELSSARATSVVRYMIYGLEMDPNRLSAVGYAKYRPASSNDSPEGRAQNRRIRMVVFKE